MLDVSGRMKMQRKVHTAVKGHGNPICVSTSFTTQPAVPAGSLDAYAEGTRLHLTMVPAQAMRDRHADHWSNCTCVSAVMYCMILHLDRGIQNDADSNGRH